MKKMSLNFLIKVTLASFTLFFGQDVMGQDGFYVGVEGGLLSGRFHYVNEKGYTLSQSSIGGLVGLYFGKKKNDFHYHVGFYHATPHHPFSEINYTTWKPARSYSAANGIENYRIPLYVGKEFKIYKRFYGVLGLGFNTIIARDVGEVSGFGVVYYDPAQSVPTATGDSTWGVLRVNHRLNFGLEPAFTPGVHLRSNVNCFLRAAYMAHFKPFSNETITHYSNQETITATRVGINSLAMVLGLSYRFRQRQVNQIDNVF